MKVGAIIQARMGSTRLPGKVLMPIGKRPLLEHLVEFLKKVRSIDEIIIATSDRKENRSIEKLAKKLNINYFRGSEEDVLDRFIQTAKKFKIDIIVRICADSFILDSENLDFLIQQHIKESPDFSHNYLHKNGLPPGAGAEIFSLQVLGKINSFVKKKIFREHIDEYILQHPEKFKILEADSKIKDQRFQFNIDKKRDFELAKRIYKNFNYDYNQLTLKNVIGFVENNKEFYKHFRQIKIILRADGSNEIGLGHISRCIALVQLLEDNFKCEILFLINNDKQTRNFILKQGYAIKKINYKDEKIILKSLINEFEPHLFIVDLPLKSENKYSNYENLNVYINYLKSLKINVLQFMDSKNPNLTNANIIINSHPTNIKSINYYFGHSYGILKREFYTEKIKEPNQEVSSILITFGGGDTTNFTLKILKSLISLKENFKIIVVLGPFFNFLNEIKNFAKDYPRIDIKQNVSNMAELMNKSDIALSAGGITLFELAYFGIPSICICDDKHQIEDAEYLDENKITINLGLKNEVNDKTIKETIKNLINNYHLRKKMSLEGRNLVNNKGIKKILNLIESQIFNNEN